MLNPSERVAEVYQEQKALATEVAAVPWTPLLAGYNALLANIEQSTILGIHASELTYWDVSQETSWEAKGSQEKGEGVEWR